MKNQSNNYKLIFSFVLLFHFNSVFPQCITTFPHTENFELAPVWTSGGAVSDWTWGTPSKATISGAGGGTKSWCIGGLTATSYNNSEQSYIKSPCYDFSTLTYLYVTFKVFWESEWLYDGASLQYSLNSGLTWTTIGAFGDPVNCMTQNWYNKSNITYLGWITPTNKNGWCGNAQPTIGACQGGNGSLAWVTAKHCLNGLAGQPNVMFRFTFGSGTTCNAFDGFAIDDFTIDNAPPNAPAFTYTCNSFTAINPLCPAPSTYLWNFGDPASGTLNTSSLANPTHNFSSAGIYTVSLTSSGGPCNAPGTVSQTISILNASITSVINNKCFGDNTGSATVTPTFGTPAYTYTWLPTGGFSSVATSLSAGSYSVIVKDNVGCTKTATVTITQPSSLTAVTSITNVSCFGGNNGAVSIAMSGGTPTYIYSWLPSGLTTNSISALSIGNYSCTITDFNNCILTQTLVISQPAVALSAIISATQAACGFPTGAAQAVASGGTSAYTYSWLPTGTTTSLISSLAPGTYTTIVTDSKLCTTTAVTTITNNAIGPTSTLTGTNVLCYGKATGIANSTIIGGLAPYTYTWNPIGGFASSAINLVAGNYTLTFADANNCSNTQTISISQNPQLIASVVNYSACPNQSVIITGLASGGVGVYTYAWNPGSKTTQTISVSEASTTNFNLVVTDVNGCSSAPGISQLYIYNTLKANINTSSSVVNEYESLINFNDNSLGNPVTWNWSFNGVTISNSQNTFYDFGSVGNYYVQLTVTDNKGCTDSIVQLIKVLPEFTFYIPNTFTPNYNGLNDVFLPVGTGWDIDNYNLSVFDRWGKQIFKTSDYLEGWNGKIGASYLTNDTYVWKVELKDFFKKSHQFMGHVVLVR